MFDITPELWLIFCIYVHQNVTKQRIRAEIPDYFNITVWASNEAGAGEPSFLPSSPSCTYVEPCDIVCNLLRDYLPYR